MAQAKVCEPELRPQAGWQDVPYLRFHDADDVGEGLEVCSAGQAQRALDFGRRHLGCDELVAHCQAGQSRSAGMALFYAETLKAPCFKITAPVTSPSYPLYSRKVYRTLLATAQAEPGQAYFAAITGRL